MSSFSLAVKNAPSGSKYWWADYSAGAVYSGWLDIAEIWDCPYGAYGKTDLHIWVVDSNYNTKHNKTGLGPIYDDKSYTYDCSTGKLIEGEIGGWQLLKSIDVTLKPPEEVGGWNLLKTIDITLTPKGVLPCTPGTTKCVGYDLCTCSAAGEWKLTKQNATECGYVPPVCSVDADCPVGYVCKDGKCVKKAAFPWQWVAIGGAAIAGVILLIPRPKKAKEKVK